MTSKGESSKDTPLKAVEEDIEEIETGEQLDEGEEDLGSFEGSFVDPMEQLSQLLVTEEGKPLVDILSDIEKSIDKQNKILYKLVSVIESKL